MNGPFSRGVNQTLQKRRVNPKQAGSKNESKLIMFYTFTDGSSKLLLLISSTIA
jgi:hypothetical protein